MFHTAATMVAGTGFIPVFKFFDIIDIECLLWLSPFFDPFAFRGGWYFRYVGIQQSPIRTLPEIICKPNRTRPAVT